MIPDTGKGRSDQSDYKIISAVHTLHPMELIAYSQTPHSSRSALQLGAHTLLVMPDCHILLLQSPSLLDQILFFFHDHRRSFDQVRNTFELLFTDLLEMDLVGALKINEANESYQ